MFSRINDPVSGITPPGPRILQDVDKIIESLRRIVAAKGCVMHRLMLRAGHRWGAAAHGEADNRVRKRGGHRTKKLTMDYYDLNEDAMEVERSFINNLVNTNTRINAGTSNNAATTEVPATTSTSTDTQIVSNIPTDEVLCDYDDNISTGSDMSIEEALA